MALSTQLMLALWFLAWAAAVVDASKRDIPMRPRSEYETARNQGHHWDFTQLPGEHHSGPGWSRHVLADEHDGAGGKVRLDFRHRLLFGERHAYHKLDEHTDLTHVGCAGRAIRLRYASGSSKWVRQLGPHPESKFKRTTLHVSPFWGCDFGLQPEGGRTVYHSVKRHACLEEDDHGCTLHHLEIEPAHMMEVFEDLDVDFHWVPAADAKGARGLHVEQRSSRQLADAENGVTKQFLEADLDTTSRRLSEAEQLAENDAMENNIIMDPDLHTHEGLKRACQGGRIVGSNGWLKCWTSTFPHNGYCFCPAGSFWNPKTKCCDVAGCDLVHNTCNYSAVPIAGSWHWWSSCGKVPGSESCYHNNFCCCPKGYEYVESVQRCCLCTGSDPNCHLSEPYTDSKALPLTNLGPLLQGSKPRGGWGINFDSSFDPPVVVRELSVGTDLLCVNCYAGIRQAEFHWRINIQKMTLLEFMLNVTLPVEFNLQLRLKPTAGRNAPPKTKEQLLKWPFPFLDLGPLELTPFLSLDLALGFMTEVHGYNLTMPDFYFRSKTTADWVWGVSYHKHSGSGPRTFLQGPQDAAFEHNIQNFTQDAFAKMLMALGKEPDLAATMEWKVEPMVVIGLDVCGLTDTGVALEVPFPIGADATETDKTKSLHRIGAAGWRFVTSPFVNDSAEAETPSAVPNASAVANASAEAGTSERRLGRQQPSSASRLSAQVDRGFASAPAISDEHEPSGMSEENGESSEDLVEDVRVEDHFWQASFLARLNDRREAYLEPISSQSYVQMCFEFLLKPGKLLDFNVKLEVELEATFKYVSETRPKGEEGVLSLCGCTPPTPWDDFLGNSDIDFRVVHDRISEDESAEWLATNLSKFQKQTGNTTPLLLFQQVVQRAEESRAFELDLLHVDSVAVLLHTPPGKRHLSESRVARASVGWAVINHGPDREREDFDLEQRTFAGVAAGRVPLGEEAAMPVAVSVAVLGSVQERWAARKAWQRHGACSVGIFERRRRLEAEDLEGGFPAHNADDLGNVTPVGPLTVGLTIKESLDLALVWSGIRITKKWLINAIELSFDIMLFVMTSGQSAWADSIVEWLQNKAKPWLAKYIPVSKRWRYQLVPYKYKSKKLTKENEFHYGLCEVVQRVVPGCPCWVIFPILLIVLAISFAIQIRYCSCLTPFFGCGCGCRLRRSKAEGDDGCCDCFKSQKNNKVDTSDYSVVNS